MNLENLGKAGLLVAQNRLQTAGHNINNAATAGYSRQTVLSETAGAMSTSAGWIGRGVQAVSVQRSYDNFLQNQLATSLMRGAALKAYGDQISQINNLVADRTVGISPAIQKFFDSLDAVASAPADVAARQELIGQANSLAAQLRDANAFIDNQRINVNTQIDTTVSQINSYLDRIQDLNRQITTAKATNPSQPPNDLLDQRDQLVSELGQLIDIKTYVQEDRVNITVGNGQTVLGGDSVFHLETHPSKADPSRTAVSFTVPGPGGTTIPVEMSDTLITGGKLGGLLTFRTDVLDSTQNDLGRIALGISVAINEQHAQGYDLSGTLGGDFFTVGTPKVIGNENNSAAAGTPAATYVPGDLSKITNQDYRIQFDGTNYTITRVPEGTAVTPTAAGTTLSFDGLEIDTAGMTPAAGDSWLIQPTRNAAAAMTVAITDPDKVAAAGEASPGVGAGTANGDNALELAALRSKKVLANGSMGLNEGYSKLVNNVAVKTQANTTAQKAQESLISQNFSAQQAVSGVNLDEEYINLQQFQEQYRAAARLIDTASTLFDTLLALRS
ncbi:Flagellar hook-associated protein FlgK [Castellaniella defragrans 65Phen]|uniref:Flagellar hook-associated protein 1 n=2 Tax=Castellaniella defragrans TaxID=75697 RepID=W8WZ08_CASD6|nr:flagellar hook-associated protein FlgK [Castellaniella defragrans]KAB0609781.1 flagellar hook-associated protein FlgK [Castellaniella defragrans]MBB6082396.1 flagellar hook-associated protein 1 FlgK [Castellaniella defragrans]CDM24819.1 Flagellar hook-associated protein FlgK [Castellaniella defragrans 65Phen]